MFERLYTIVHFQELKYTFPRIKIKFRDFLKFAFIYVGN